MSHYAARSPIIVASLLAFAVLECPAQSQHALPPIKTVFIIMEENHDWAQITSSAAPYIRNSLVPMGAHAEQYYNPPGNHPSEANYVWLEAGSNLGIGDDLEPAVNHQTTADHLVTYLNKAGISWKVYQEDIDGKSCPLVRVENYAPKHNPFVFFDDVTDRNSIDSMNCISHIRPYSEFVADLQNNTIARYNFITPNLCNDMHDCGATAGDSWLAKEVPKILGSRAYKDAGALFITWDEGGTGDGPIGMLVISPFAKFNYSNSVHYTHSSTLRTVQEIFGVTPLLRDAATAEDLSDLFITVPPAITAVVNGASFTSGFQPGSWVTISGTSLAANTRSWRSEEIVGGHLPQSLDNVSVTINGLPAFVSYISPTQLNLQAPTDASIVDGQSVPITVTSPAGIARTTAIARLIDPAIFLIDSQRAAAINMDGTTVAPTGVFPGSRPAKPGDFVELYVTGLGPTNPPVPAGQIFAAPAAAVNPVRLTIGGTAALVSFAGLVTPGLYQVNFVVPDLPDGDWQIKMQVGSVPCQNTALLAIHR